jgi:hypothetical protein
MKTSNHLGQSVSLGLLLFVACAAFVSFMASQSGAL